MRPAPLLSLMLAVAGCGATSTVRLPGGTLRGYVEAVERSEPAAAYALLSQRQRRMMTADQFAEAARVEADELRDQGRQLRRHLEEPIPVTAQVELANGEVVTLVLEQGRWRIAEAIAGAASQRSPQQTVRALRRALQRRSYHGVLRLLSSDARAQVEDEILRIADALGRGEEVQVEVTGNRARVTYDQGHFIDLVREGGEWLIADMN